ncbi:MAG: hypothetical protein K1060chlam2_00474 [Chlamydiae bacterium]|nr:hypothetical protein [Chlamydiota bacterium]
MEIEASDINLESLQDYTIESESEELLFKEEESSATFRSADARRKAYFAISDQKNLQETMVTILAPEYQEKIEKEAIRSSEKLRELIGGREIQRIIRVDGGYNVTAEDLSIRVDVNYISMFRCGPAEFELHFGLPIIAY